MSAPKFTLLDGLTQVKRFELALAPLGWHCALGGGLIYKGYSHKDIDIIAYPHSSENPAPFCVEGFAAELGFKAKPLGSSCTEDTRNVWILTNPEGVRVDLFVKP